jgi:hypothetical protein
MSTDLEPIAGLQDESLRQVLSVVDIVFVDADALNPDDYEQAAQELRLLDPGWSLSHWAHRVRWPAMLKELSVILPFVCPSLTPPELVIASRLHF